MGVVWPSRSAKREHRAAVPPMSPSWLRTFRSAWRTLVDRLPHPVATTRPDPAARSRNPKRERRGRSKTAGPGGGAALGGEASGRHRLARLRAHYHRRRPPMAPHQPPASGWCCCPHPDQATGTRPTDRRAGRTTGMNQDDFPRPPPAQNSDTMPVIAANTQWHHAELALKMARRSYERRRSEPPIRGAASRIEPHGQLGRLRSSRRQRPQPVVGPGHCAPLLAVVDSG